MNSRLARPTEIAFALMRFVVGVLFACHGAQKVFGVFGGQAMIRSPLIVAAGVIELACGVLVAIGLLARPAAFLASGEMAVAYFKAHAFKGFWPIQNKGLPVPLHRGARRGPLQHRRPGAARPGRR